MATSSQSNSDGNAKKVPMSPSEFFAKIYGTDRKSADSSSSTEEDKPTASGMQIVTHRSLTETAHPSSLAAIALQQHRSVSATSSWHLYPSWNPEQLFWASRNHGSFFDPLSLPPALTAAHERVINFRIRLFFFLDSAKTHQALKRLELSLIRSFSMTQTNRCSFPPSVFFFFFSVPLILLVA